MRFTRPRSPLAAAAAVLPLTAAAVALTSAPAQAAAPADGGTYQLSVTKSGKCLDVVAGSKDNGALLQQWGCTDAAWQRFTLKPAGSGVYNLVNEGSGRCVDVPGGSTASGTRLQQWGCGDGTKPNQQWRLTASGSGTYQIVNVASGLCMSDQGASTASGAAIIQETCTHNTNKQWRFTPATGGTPSPAPTAPTGRTWPDTADGFAATGGMGVGTTTGGAAGSTVTVTTYADLVKYATAKAPYVIRVNGAITVTPKGTEIKVASGKTIVGVGTKGHIVGGGFFLGSGVNNVIIRNLTIRDTRMADDDPDDKVYDYDGIQMDGAHHVWIDHNHITRMNDGLIDSRKDTSHVTVSWNILSDNNKAFGIGWTDNVTSRLTIHHNWIRDTNQRNPSTDNVAYAHLYNNHLQNVASYGNYARGGTRMVLENSYFDKVKDPYYRDDTAQLRQSGSVVVNSTGQRETGGSAFDPRSFYSYTLDPAADVPALLRTHAGPQAGIGL
ncbi:RICIN domain-containing protein [Planomonospora sp. ID82291]|uniref:RICIN domain-containing protein n=1 Tax=Planomonospora sp. ID82291 TaxID=2738136 RepID=UPI0018C381B9|nr:RICIN domain-containing protein [Planomonospora sp. ID82291]MBG0818054.1 RICIN domain-containing protein [Planomonospora sp. ID82291]